jgi:hypothetical protein
MRITMISEAIDVINPYASNSRSSHPVPMPSLGAHR